MNSTERLLAVHRGQMPDRVPVSTYELVGPNATAWENQEPSYQSLMEFIRKHTDCLYMTNIPVPNALAAQVDRTVDRWDEGDQHVERRVVRVSGRELTTVVSHADNVKTVWTREHPVKSLDDLEAYLAIPWAPGEADFSKLQQAWDDLEGRLGLPLVSMGDPICNLAEAFEFGEFTIFAMTETEALIRAFDILHERYVETLRRMLRGPVKNVVFRICGPEYATPPYLPPRLFRQFVTRYDAVYCRMIREAGGIPRIHCHGRIGQVVDQFVEMGAEATDPIEPPPDGDITIAELKQRVGDRLCLTGGIELKHLEHADGEFVDRLVRDLMAQGKPGGRFVLMPTAGPINIPLSPRTRDNYMRFIETALEVGRY